MGNDIRSIIRCVFYPSDAQVCAALGCTFAEFDTLSLDEQRDLAWYLVDQLMAASTSPEKVARHNAGF
jgi:hypothetical protein